MKKKLLCIKTLSFEWHKPEFQEMFTEGQMYDGTFSKNGSYAINNLGERHGLSAKWFGIYKGKFFKEHFVFMKK